MMKLLTLVVGASFAGAALAPAMASATITFSAYDDGASTAAAAVNSNAAQAAFMADTAPNLITFETAPLGSTNDLMVASGVFLGFDDQSIVNSDAGCFGGPAVCGFNITSGGSRWASLDGGTLTFNFATPVNAFGAYLTGVQLADSIEVNGTTIVSVQNASVPDGGVAFLGFVGGPLTSQVVINAQPGGIGDVIGVDNVQYHGVPVPEPATWAMMLLGVGAIGASLRVVRRTHAETFGAA